MVTVYCLKLRSGKYYVGKTNNVNFRLEDHFDGNGSEWTRLYKPVSVYAIYHNCDDFDEDKYTEMAMSQFGIDNVRGGSYSQVVLPGHVVDVLTRKIRGATDVCYKCGRSGHFASDCRQSQRPQQQRTVTCYRCGRAGHYADECRPAQAPSQASSQQMATNNVTCYRCGRKGHYADECWSSQASSQQMATNNVTCYRCGKKGHYADECWS